VKLGVQPLRISRWYLLLAALIALLQAYWLHRVLPTGQNSRDIATARALSFAADDPAGIPKSASPTAQRQAIDLLKPEDYCHRWTSLPSAAIDCRNGLRLDTLTTLTPGPEARQVDEIARSQIIASISRFQELEGILRKQRAADPSLQQPLMALQLRRLTLERAVNAQPHPTESPRVLPWFETLLTAQGQRYSASEDRFRIIGWDVARLLDQTEWFSLRGKQTSLLLEHLPRWWLAAVGILLLTATWRAGLVGLFVIGGLTGCLALGTWLTLAASIHFGEGTSSFPLNPLGNQAQRQAIVLAISAVILLIMMGWTGLGALIGKHALRHPGGLGVFVAVSVVATYAVSGPAMGSEVLKCGVALLAATMMAGLGRLVHAANQFVPKALSPRSWLGASDEVGRTVAKHLGLPLVTQIGLLTGTLLIVATVFRDLGGVLVASLVGLVAVVLVFGARLGAILITLFGLVGAALLMTDKLKDRLALMHDPWTASVSDFARLEAFSQGAGASGYGINETPWCSGGGACLPLQILSDYMPVLLRGALGPWPMVVLFLALCLSCVGLAAWAARRYLVDRGETRLLSMTIFYLLIATLLQTIITFFGNWRWIPLTGLGTPLLSIGLSSVLAPVFAAGLIVQVEALHRKNDQL
jgi:cell division protein FtsW (lipid II flippase)